MRFIEQTLIRSSQIDGYRYLPAYAVVTRMYSLRRVFEREFS